MDRVSSFLTAVLHKRGLASHAQGALAVLRAKEWLDAQLPHLAGFIHVRRVNDGEMMISCKNAIAMQECHSMISGLLDELKRDSSCGAVRSVRVERV